MSLNLQTQTVSRVHWPYVGTKTARIVSILLHLSRKFAGRANWLSSKENFFLSSFFSSLFYVLAEVSRGFRVSHGQLRRPVKSPYETLETSTDGMKKEAERRVNDNAERTRE